MKGNKRRNTGPEVALRSELHALGLRFRKDYLLRPPGRRPVRVDIAFTRLRVAVFVDGCFWHSCPEHSATPKSNSSYWAPKLKRNVERDREIDAALQALGWDVIHVWEHVAAATAAVRIARALERRGATAPR